MRVSPRPLSTYLKWEADRPFPLSGERAGTITGAQSNFRADALCNDNWVAIAIGNNGLTSWTIEFSVPAGQQIRPGTYPNAITEIRDARSPALIIHGEPFPWVCSQGTGTFSVSEAVFANGRVERFRATFTQVCSSSPEFPTVSGEISLQSPPPNNRFTSCLR